MKDKPKQKSQGSHIPKSSKKNNSSSILIAAVIILAALAAYLFWPASEITSGENTLLPAPVATSPSSSADKEKLVGRWQRTDGGYIIELKNPTPSGLIEANYFNPNPINVGKSAWQIKEGRLMVLVELQDQNYPGSLYNLKYQPETDKLAGSYFQAVEKQTYNVEFTRLQK